MAIECPVCTLYLRSGMTLAEHLDTHPKENVIKALVNRVVKQDAVGFFPGSLEELGSDEILPVEGSTPSIDNGAVSNTLTIRTNERTTALGIYEAQPMYMDNTILASSSNTVQASVSQPSQFAVVKAIDAHGIPSFQLNNVTLIKREIVQPVVTVAGVSSISTVAAAAPPATIGPVQNELSGIGSMGEDYLEPSGNGTGEAGCSRVVGPAVASTTVFPRYTNELYSGPPPPYSRAISSTVATNTQITPMQQQQQTVQLNLPKSTISGSVSVIGQQIQLLPKIHTETTNSAFKQYPTVQPERSGDESANQSSAASAPKSGYSGTATTIATRMVTTTAITTTCSTSSTATAIEQPSTVSTPVTTASKSAQNVSNSSKANVVKVISNVKVQSKLKDIQEIILQLNAGQMSIVGDKTTLIPPTTERRASAFASSGSGRSLLAIAPAKVECSSEEQLQEQQQQVQLPVVNNRMEQAEQNGMEQMAGDYDHEEEYSDAWQDDDNYADDEIREQWEEAPGAKRFASGNEQCELHPGQPVAQDKTALATISTGIEPSTNSTSSGNAMVTSVIRKTPQPLPCLPSPVQQDSKTQIKRLVFRVAGNATPTTVTISPAGPSTSPKIVRAWQGIKLECSTEDTGVANDANCAPADEEPAKPMSCASSALAGSDYAARQKQRFRPPKKLAIKPKRTHAEGCNFPNQHPDDCVQGNEPMTSTNSPWTSTPSTTIPLATALTTLAEVVCTSAAQQQQQPSTETFSSTSFNGITAVIQKTDTNSGIAAISPTVPSQTYQCADRETMEYSHPSTTPPKGYVSSQQLLMAPIKQEYSRPVDSSIPDVPLNSTNKANQMLHGGVRAPYTFGTPETGTATNAGHKPLHPTDEIDVGAYNISYVSETGETIYHPLPKKVKRTPRSEDDCSTSRSGGENMNVDHANSRAMDNRDGSMELIVEDVKVCGAIQGEDLHDHSNALNENEEMIQTEEDEKETTDEMDQDVSVVHEDSEEDENDDDVFEVEAVKHEQNPSPISLASEQPSHQRLLMVLTRVNNTVPTDTPEQDAHPTFLKDAVETVFERDSKDSSLVQQVIENNTIPPEEGLAQPYCKSEGSMKLPANLVMKRLHTEMIFTAEEKDLLEAGPSSRAIVHVGVPRPNVRVTNAGPFQMSSRAIPRKAEKDERKKSDTAKRRCGKDFLEAGPPTTSSSTSLGFAAVGPIYEQREEGSCFDHHSFNSQSNTASTTTMVDEQVQLLPESIVELKQAKTEPYMEDEQEEDTSTSSFLDLSTIPKNSLDGMTTDTASITSHSSSHSAGLGKDNGEGSGGTRSLLPSGSSITSTSMERAPSTESLNIRTDEKMPAKGEISEQESNGDMDVTSWNHRMYAVGENMPIYPSSYDLSTAQECWNLSSRNQGMFAVTDHFYHQQQHSGGNNTHGNTVSNQYMHSHVAFQFSSNSHQQLQQHGPDMQFGSSIITSKVEPHQDDDNDSDDVDEQAEGRRLKNAIPKLPFADMMVARMHEPPGAYDEVVTQHHHQQQPLQQQQSCEMKYDDPVGTTSYFGVAVATCSTLPLMSSEQPVLPSRPKPSGSGVTRTFRCTLCPKVFDTIKQRRVHQQREHANELLSLSSHTQNGHGVDRSGEGQQQQQQQQQVYKKQPIPVVMNYDWMKQEIERKSEASLRSSRMLMQGCSSSTSNVAVPGTSGEEMQQEQKLLVAQVQMAEGSAIVGSSSGGGIAPSMMRDEGMLSTACTVAARNRSYVCSTCNQKFDRFNLFNEHLLEHPVECFACGRHFKQWRNFSLHIKRHLGIKEHQCRSCGKQFVIKQKLIEHMRVHTGHAPIKCKLCNRSFKRFSNLAQHRKRYHLNRTVTKEDYVCQLCGEVFHTHAKMEWHKETHEKKPKSCPYCREKFIHRNSLTRHIRLSHTDKYAKLENKTEPCSICQQPYTKTSMRRHMETHTKERMAYACGICNKRFTTNWNLKQHKWTHANPTMKPFQCTYCPSAFVRESDFVTHVNAHRSIRPYTCNHCGSQFIRKYNWIRHTREHEIDKGHRCDVCGRQFHRKYYLTEHKRIHTGERPFACNICGKTSATKTNHNKHVRIHHARDPLTAEG
uniref:C2H2-type domain-containing protein n=1 Tax=Anopheles culicifacies TaxID=139723 RepID=A0A182M1U3_9DIPT